MDKMKDSGIEWVGKIPKNWEVIRNKYIMYKNKKLITKYNNEDILSLTMKGVIKRNLDAGGKMPSTFNGYQKINSGNLLLCLFDIDVTPRCVGIIKDNGITSPAYSQFILKPNNDVRFYYYYYLVTDNNKALVHLSKSLRHSLTEEQFGNINTIRPPFSQQKAISDFLDKKCKEIDTISTQIQNEIDTLQEYRKSIISKTVTKGINNNVLMKDSGIEWIGKIPKDWKLEKLKYLTQKVQKGLSPQYSDIGTTNIITQATFSKGYWDQSSVKKAIATYVDKKNNIIKKNDILLATTGGGVLGKTYFMENDIAYVASADVAFIRANNNRIISKLIYYCLTINYDLINGIMAQGSTNQLHLNIENLKNFKLPIGPIEVQQKIVNYLDKKIAKIDKLIALKQQQLSLLSDYKNSLIFEYVTGKKQVSVATGEK